MRYNKSAQFLERNPSRPNEENSITFMRVSKQCTKKEPIFEINVLTQKCNLLNSRKGIMTKLRPHYYILRINHNVQ